jgi:hypothetical protein
LGRLENAHAPAGYLIATGRGTALVEAGDGLAAGPSVGADGVLDPPGTPGIDHYQALRLLAPARSG